MAGRRLKRKAAKDTATARAQRKMDLLAKKKDSMAKARAVKARKFQQLQKEKQRHAQSATTASASAAATAAASPAGLAESYGGGENIVGRGAQQRRFRSPDISSGGASAGPAGRCSDPGLQEEPRDDVLEHAAAALEEEALLRRDSHLQANGNKRSNEKHQLGSDGPFIPSGVLVGHRILRLFGNDDGAECVGGQDGCLVLRTPMSEEAEEVGSALFIGTVMAYRPPKAYEDLMPSGSACVHDVQDDGDDAKKGGRRKGRKKKKRRGGRPRKDAVRELDFALYRVHFDDGDVMDMEPREVFECSQLYDAKREDISSSSFRYTGPPPMIMGRDHADPDQPANLESGLREILRHANPSCDSLLADPSTLRALDTEIQGYWVQYRVHHIQRGIPRPPSMLSDEEHSRHQAVMASLSHHRDVDAALLSPFVNSFDHEEQLGMSDANIDSTRGSGASTPPAFDFHDDIPRTPGGSLSLDRPSHTPTKRAVSHGVCEEEDGKPAARRHRHQRSDSSALARAPAPARGREDVSIVSDDDSSHSAEEPVMADTIAASARPLNTREAPNVSPEHTGPESPYACSKHAEDLPTLEPPRDTAEALHAETQSMLHSDEEAPPVNDLSSVAASDNTGATSSGGHITECAQEKSLSAPGHSNPDESVVTNVAPILSQAFNSKLYGFERRVSHQHRRMKKPKAQGRARFPVLPLASRKRKKDTSSSSDEVTATTTATTDAKSVTPSPTGRTLQKVSVGGANLPNLAPSTNSSVASPVLRRDETAEDSKSRRIDVPNQDGMPSGTDALEYDAISTPTNEMPTAKIDRALPTILVPEGEQIEVSETPHDSEHSVTMHEFAEIMAAPSPARASVTFAASVKEAAEEPLASSGPISTSVATTSVHETAATAPLADAIVGRMINGEGGSQKQNYSILSRAYAVGPGMHRSRGPDIHVVLSAVYEPPSSQPTTKVGSDSTTSGVLPSLQMQQSQDSASRYMSSDYRYKAEVADDSRISSLPNVTHLAECLAKKYAFSGQWSARIDLILSVEGDGLARWPGTPSVDRYTALSVMTGFPPDEFPPEAIDGGTSIAATFREGRVVDITKGHLRGQRGVVRKIIRPAKLLVMIIENDREKEHLIMAADARQLSQDEMVRSLLQGSSKQYDMNMSDLDHAILVGSPHPRSRNEDFLADVDHMLNEELHEIDAVSAMNMFPPGDPGRVSTFVPTSAALSALKASPYSTDGRAVRRRRTVRKPKRQGGRRRKIDATDVVSVLGIGATSDGTTKKKRGRKRKNDGNLKPNTTKSGSKPDSEDASSKGGIGIVGTTKRRGRKPSTSKRDKPSAPKDDADTSTQRRRGRAPRIEGESTIRIKIRRPVPGKVSDEDSVGTEPQLPVPKRRLGNHGRKNSAQPLPVPKEPAVQKAALDRVETMLRKKAERMKGTEKWEKRHGCHGKGDISVDSWGLLALLGVFEMRDAVKSLGYKPIGNKVDMLVQLSSAYQNLGLEMPKVDV
eukprot:CAMPEP_0181029150 /NCGR_PEP_ID=MMETSP1070-20121207/5043_1 /TAXON_ID=265543 /ORGANISM="Minutocellus polymorphus, Strain NH13" /LENGTH=1489 /DNA_ID=CAMNT_0023106437 /DNA_START=337 /DNA_END=4806 /DNA_ORIENTATION=-